MRRNTAMENNRVAFLRWWLLFSLILFGISCLFKYDMFSIINAGDVTKLSFGIFVIFLFSSCYVGWETYRLYRGGQVDLQRIDLGHFIADHLLTLGLVGTVIGFIYMLGTTFANIDITQIASLKGALVNMSLGMSTALYTTVSGLICSLLLKIQLLNLDYYNET